MNPDPNVLLDAAQSGVNTVVLYSFLVVIVAAVGGVAILVRYFIKDIIGKLNLLFTKHDDSVKEMSALKEKDAELITKVESALEASTRNNTAIYEKLDTLNKNIGILLGKKIESEKE